jgi:cytochrome P450
MSISGANESIVEVSLEALNRDPYPVYERLRRDAPLSRIPELGMWYATRYQDVRAMLLDDVGLTTGWPDSTIQQTFGKQMLTSEGDEHARYRRAAQPAFLGPNIRDHIEPAIRAAVDALAASWAGSTEVELRSRFASRLPVQTILLTFGLSTDAEKDMRGWYDSFEEALANFTGDPLIRERAAKSIADFHDYLDREIASALRSGSNPGLLGALLNAPPEKRLSGEEIKRNMSIIFFGGISTVEGLLLNMIWALGHAPAALARVYSDRSRIPSVIDETMRWLSPVQSATRHVTREMVIGDVALSPGDIVNCMLGAANRDPEMFPDPDRFDIDRPNRAQHLGFASGPHMCLGFRLARAEAAIALDRLLDEFGAFEIVASGTTPPEGYEFRQCRLLTIARR